MAAKVFVDVRLGPLLCLAFVKDAGPRFRAVRCVIVFTERKKLRPFQSPENLGLVSRWPLKQSRVKKLNLSLQKISVAGDVDE